MKKFSYVVHIIFGTIISIFTLMLTNQILGMVYVNNGNIDFMIKELFQNLTIKYLVVCVIGMILGIINYVISEKDRKETKYKFSFLMIILVTMWVIMSYILMTRICYSIIFALTYIALLLLIMALLDFIRWVINGVSDKRDIEQINKKLEKNSKGK